MNSFPTFDPEPIKAPNAEQTDKEIWFPDWQCFCCHDYGLVADHLISLVIPSFSKHADKMPVCQRCSAGAEKLSSPAFDQRFTWRICNDLDKLERDNWKSTVKNQQRRFDLDRLAKSMAMPGTRDRTANDEREILQRKAEIEGRKSAESAAINEVYS